MERAPRYSSHGEKRELKEDGRVAIEDGNLTA